MTGSKALAEAIQVARVSVCDTEKEKSSLLITMLCSGSMKIVFKKSFFLRFLLEQIPQNSI